MLSPFRNEFSESWNMFVVQHDHEVMEHSLSPVSVCVCSTYVPQHIYEAKTVVHRGNSCNIIINHKYSSFMLGKRQFASFP